MYLYPALSETGVAGLQATFQATVATRKARMHEATAKTFFEFIEAPTTVQTDEHARS